MFSLKDFIKQGFMKGVGRMADYQIILNAAGWLEKGVLDEDDLAEIQRAIDAQYPIIETTDNTISDSESVAEEFEEVPAPMATTGTAEEQDGEGNNDTADSNEENTNID